MASCLKCWISSKSPASASVVMRPKQRMTPRPAKFSHSNYLVADLLPRSATRITYLEDGCCTRQAISDPTYISI